MNTLTVVEHLSIARRDRPSHLSVVEDNLDLEVFQPYSYGFKGDTYFRFRGVGHLKTYTTFAEKCTTQFINIWPPFTF